jgi:hypothetical protein
LRESWRTIAASIVDARRRSMCRVDEGPAIGDRRAFG